MNKRVIFVAENGDECVVSWDDLVEFQMQGVDTTIFKLPEEGVAKRGGFKRALVEISKKVDREHIAFGSFPIGQSEFHWLKTCDLAQIIIDDGTERNTYYLTDAQAATSFIFSGNLVLEIQ